jgi:hypothetical protein
MAVMNAEDRTRAWITIMKVLASDIDIEDSAVRDAILAAVAAADTWVDTNQASYVAALPEPFKSTSTPRQKVAVLALVLHERFNTGTE